MPEVIEQNPKETIITTQSCKYFAEIYPTESNPGVSASDIANISFIAGISINLLKFMLTYQSIHNLKEIVRRISVRPLRQSFTKRSESTYEILKSLDFHRDLQIPLTFCKAFTLSSVQFFKFHSHFTVKLFLLNYGKRTSPKY